jgi:hypothetical protein
MESSEWVAGVVPLPSFVTGDGEPYRPAALLLVESDSGLIVGTELARPEDLLERAPEMFHQAARAPLVGSPREPARVRVASPDLFAALHDQVGDVEVVLAPTPELEPVAAGLCESLGQLPADEEGFTYLGPDITPDDVAHMFRAAARLYRLRPWTLFPADGFASIDCAALGVAGGALCVVGQAGESFGFALFSSRADAVAFTETDMEAGPTLLPRHFMFTYDEEDDLAPPMVREIDEFGWEVAGPGAFPQALLIDPDCVVRGLTRAELAGLTAVIEALADLVDANPDLAAAWEEADERRGRSDVSTALGTIAVELAVPLDLEDAGEVAVDRLVGRFADSPEASPELIGWVEMLADYADPYCGAELSELTPGQLHELLFEVVPRKVSAEPAAAPEIVAAARAFFTFAARELGSRSARKCVDSLGPDAERHLAREMADPRNFGLAKSFFMSGLEAGHDMTTEAGIQAWQAAFNRAPMSRPALLPEEEQARPPAPRSRAAAAKARAKRKASRKARKKSRR